MLGPFSTELLHHPSWYDSHIYIQSVILLCLHLPHFFFTLGAVELIHWAGLKQTICIFCQHIALFVTFVQLSQWDPLIPLPGFHTPPPWQDRTRTTVKTTNQQLSHILLNIDCVLISISVTSACALSQSLLPSQNLMTCLFLQVKQTWQPSSRWCSCLTLA